MISLNLPNFEIKLQGSAEKPSVWDILRRKYVALTPEEWVRQNFIHFLVEHKGFPASLLANEVKLEIGNKKLRADSVLYGTDLKPRMIIEYKAPHIAITQKVFNQITVYNMLMHVDYLIVSNGIQHYICKMDYIGKKYLFLKDIPDYQNL
jgi:predicted type IV restriction endonuclease